MKVYIKKFFAIYFAWVLAFLTQKPMFMLCHLGLFKSCNMTDWFSVMYHGLSLDLSLAGYLSVIPALLIIMSIWTRAKAVSRIAKVYFAITAAIIAIAFVVNIALYGFWGIPLDTTPLFYFFSSPEDALASVSLWFILGAIAGMAVCATATYMLLTRAWCIGKGRPGLQLPIYTMVMILLTGLLFLPIRGGITASTANTGKVYYSENMQLNHAAVNPLFSLMEAALHEKDFGQQYRFMSNKRANKLFAQLVDRGCPEREDALFTMRRPNILFIIMESFSSKLMQAHEKSIKITHNIERLAQEGIYFDNFYANSFRTDRGLVAILSGYPAQPTMSIMKYPRKTQHLPSICASLKEAGYTTRYYYGGDADFCNMRSYLVSSGFGKIVDDSNFPISYRISKWGVPDHIVLNKAVIDMQREKQTAPTFTVIQTSSSHEPFDVPYQKLANKALNAFAYTDSCVGDFVNRLKHLPLWRNTIVLLVPDHLGVYPENISNYTLDRYRIPLIITGGAIRKKRIVNTIGSQHDIAATLLSQLGLPHRAFTFSKNMLNNSTPHFAFFTVPDAFGMVTANNELIFDNKSGKIKLNTGPQKSKNLDLGKAYLQKLYDDIDKR